MNGRILLASLLAAALGAAGLAWLWYDQMEKRWEPEKRISQAAIENPMLAATLLLRQAGHPVRVAGTLGELDLSRLPDGTLIIVNSAGVVHPATADALLAWVRRGNTLVTEPRWASADEKKQLAAAAAPEDERAAPPDDEEDSEDDEDSGDDEEGGGDEGGNAGAGHDGAKDAPAREAPKKTAVQRPDAEELETDPLAFRFGVRQLYKPRPRKCAPPAAGQQPAAGKRPAPTPIAMPHVPRCIPAADYRPRLRSVVVPGVAWPLTLDESFTSLRSLPAARTPLWSDTAGEALRVYAEGRGRVIMMSDNYFGNDDLRQYDHAELLLALSSLATGARSVTIVQMLDMLPWYRALWQYWHHALVALAVFLALAFWMAVRRFGPMLPAPANERRSLMEHIAASGAWLWKAEGGAELLLHAAREETLALVRRRAPALMRLPVQQLAAALARDTGLDPEHLAQALQDDASRQVARFTRQIRTLQELRNHYER